MSAVKSWKVWLLVATLFVSGALVGAFAMRAYMARNLPDMLAHSRQRLEERFLETIDHEVGLTDAQKQAVLPLLKNAVEQGEAAHQTVRVKIDGIMRDTDARIAELLDPDQRVKFEAFRKRMEEFRRQGPGHGGPPPPGMPGFPPGPPPDGGPHPGPPDAGGRP